MVGHHVPQGARLVVVPTPLLHAQGFGHRNLHVVDVAAVPDGFEDSVGESEHQNVLNRFLAQVVVDAIDLAFLQGLDELSIQGPGRLQIVAVGLFDDDPSPSAFRLPGQPRRLQLLDHGGKVLGSGRQIVEVVAPGAVLAVDAAQQLPEVPVGRSFFKIAAQIVDLAGQPAPEARIHRTGGMLCEAFGQLPAEVVMAHRPPGETHDGEILPKQ